MGTQELASPLHVLVALDNTTTLQQLQVSSQQLPDPPTHFHVAYPADTATVTLRALHMVGRVVHAVLIGPEANSQHLAGILQEAPQAVLVVVSQPPHSAAGSNPALPSHVDYLADPTDRDAVHGVLLRAQAKRTSSTSSARAGGIQSASRSLSIQQATASQLAANGSRAAASGSGHSSDQSAASHQLPASHPVALPNAMVALPQAASRMQRAGSGAGSSISSAAGSIKSAAAAAVQVSEPADVLFPAAHPLSKINRTTSPAYNIEILPVGEQQEGMMLLNAQDAAVAKLRMAVQRPSFSGSGCPPSTSLPRSQQDTLVASTTSVSTSISATPTAVLPTSKAVGPAEGSAVKTTAVASMTANSNQTSVTNTSGESQGPAAASQLLKPGDAMAGLDGQAASTAQARAAVHPRNAPASPEPSATAVTASVLLQQLQQLRAQLDSKQARQQSSPSTPTANQSTPHGPFPSQPLPVSDAKQSITTFGTATGLLQLTGSSVMPTSMHSGGGSSIGHGNLLMQHAASGGTSWPQPPPNSPPAMDSDAAGSFSGAQLQQILLSNPQAVWSQQPSLGPGVAPASPGPLQTPFCMPPAFVTAAGSITWADSVTGIQPGHASAAANSATTGHPSLEDLARNGSARRSTSPSPARERLYSRMWGSSGGGGLESTSSQGSPTAVDMGQASADDAAGVGSNPVGRNNSFVSAGSSRYNPLRKSGKLSLEDDTSRAAVSPRRSSEEMGTGLAGSPLAASSSLYLSSSPSAAKSSTTNSHIPAVHYTSEIQPIGSDAHNMQLAAATRSAASSSGGGAGSPSATGTSARPSRLQRVTVGNSFDAASHSPHQPPVRLMSEPRSVGAGSHSTGHHHVRSPTPAGMEETEDLLSIRSKPGVASYHMTGSLHGSQPGNATYNLTGSAHTNHPGGGVMNSNTGMQAASHPAAFGSIQGLNLQASGMGSKQQLSALGVGVPGPAALCKLAEEDDQPEQGSPRETECHTASTAVAATWMHGVQNALVLRGILGMNNSIGKAGAQMSTALANNTNSPQGRSPAGALTAGSPAGSQTPLEKRAARQRLGSHPIHIQWQDWLLS